MQILISIRRKRIGSYLGDWWNRLDWLTMTMYLGGMLTKLGSGDSFHNASKILLVLTFILMCVRFVNSLTISEIIGAKLVMIRKMVNREILRCIKTIFFLLITCFRGDVFYKNHYMIYDTLFLVVDISVV
jgi:hypothetical protein